MYLAISQVYCHVVVGGRDINIQPWIGNDTYEVLLGVCSDVYEVKVNFYSINDVVLFPLLVLNNSIYCRTS